MARGGGEMYKDKDLRHTWISLVTILLLVLAMACRGGDDTEGMTGINATLTVTESPPVPGRLELDASASSAGDGRWRGCNGGY